VARRTTVPDDPAAIHDAVSQALDRTGIVLTTGGLGPTRDDITKQVIADLYGWPLEWRPAIWESLVARFAAAGRVPVAANRCQAEVPAGAMILPNPRGTAPGLWLEGAPGLVIMLPGVPREMAGLLREEVMPRLADRIRARTPEQDPPVIRSLVVRTTGLPESSLAEQVTGVEERIAPLTLAYLPGIDGVDLRLTAWNLPPSEAARRLDAAARDLERTLAPYAWGRDDDDVAARVLAFGDRNRGPRGRDAGAARGAGLVRSRRSLGSHDGSAPVRRKPGGDPGPDRAVRTVSAAAEVGRWKLEV
jgi:nicotinamide-nucleotide amidase